MNQKIRLNKFLATIGIGSRRKVNDLVKEGRVMVNNSPAQLNSRIDPVKDSIFVDNQKVQNKVQLNYILLNKPKGVISTTNDEFQRRSITDLIDTDNRIYPVGRLDAMTTGLMLLTNDGELTYRLTHPKFHIPKTYELLIQGTVEDKLLQKLEQGVVLKEPLTLPTEARVIWIKDNRTLIELTIHQGWNHQIRRMCGVLNLQLISLKRIAIGSIKLGNLEEGKYRYLTQEEIDHLKDDITYEKKKKP